MANKNLHEYSDHISILGTVPTLTMGNAWVQGHDDYIGFYVDRDDDITARMLVSDQETSLINAQSLAIYDLPGDAAQSQVSSSLKIYSVDGSTGSTYIGGDLRVDGNVYLSGGTIKVGDNINDNLHLTARLNTSIIPKTTDTYDLGTSTLVWREIFANDFTGGDAALDNVHVSQMLRVDGNTYLSGGVIKLGDNANDDLYLTGEIHSNMVPNVDNTRDIGTTDKRWRHLYTHTGVFDHLYVSGNLRVDGNVYLSGGESGSINVGNATTDTVNMTARVGTDIVPKTTETYSLGTSTNTWLNIHTQSLSATGAVDIDSDLNVGGDLTVDGNVYLKGDSGGVLDIGDTNTDSVIFKADVKSHFLPDTTGTYNLGSSSKKWKNLYIGDISSGGNITLTGTVDGRDISNDGSKLDSVYTTVNTKSGNWDTAYGWGDHAAAGYWVDDATKRGNWDTAYGWGDHGAAGYLTSFTETDPVFSAHAAANVTTQKITNWDTAYGWGDHGTVGYWVDDATKRGNWDTAHGWGDHGAAGYVNETGDTMTGDLTFNTANVGINLGSTKIYGTTTSNSSKKLHVTISNNNAMELDDQGNMRLSGDLVVFDQLAASDKNLKTNIKPIPSDISLTKILNLQGVEYNWKDRTDKETKLGLIAQEVQEHVPEAIKMSQTLNDETEFLSVNYLAIIPLLIESIKEQNKQIMELKTRITQLEQ